MTLRERLEQLVRTAPRGTLIPVEGLAGLIQTPADEETDLDVENIGRLAATLLPNVMGIISPSRLSWNSAAGSDVHIDCFKL